MLRTRTSACTTGCGGRRRGREAPADSASIRPSPPATQGSRGRRMTRSTRSYHRAAVGNGGRNGTAWSTVFRTERHGRLAASRGTEKSMRNQVDPAESETRGRRRSESTASRPDRHCRLAASRRRTERYTRSSSPFSTADSLIAMEGR